jgi:signal transduction histidine kinase/CheY-like chemotaxis protein
MSNISQSLISTAPMAGLIKDALRRTGEFLKVSRCFIIVVDAQTGKSQPAYAWHAAPNDVANREMNSGVWPRFYPHSNSSSAATAEEMQGEKDGTAPAHPSPASEEIGELLLDIFPAVAPEPGADDGDNGASDSERNTPICKRQPTLQPVYCSDINSGKEGLCETFKKAGFKAFIMTPLYLDGVLWGVLVIESGVDKREWSTNDAQLVSTVSSAIVGVVARDLIEKERKAAFDQAVLASRAKGDFLSNMSHEMRTPMNAIIGMSTIGLAATEIKRKDYCLEKVNDASTHLLGIINDVLDMSKIEANKLELSYVSFNFAKMVERVVNVISFRVNERQQSFRVSIDEAIPRNIITDDQRLAQVLTNLLSNATKFTPEGGSIGLDVRLHEQKADALTLQIEVSDTGIGISSEQQARLFTSFEQADRGTARKFGGTGLGLAISKRIIELMDGKIWIDSELGKGATFTFTVKVRLGKEEGYSYLPTSVNWDNIHMLAVDDCLDELFAGNAARLAEIDAQQLPDFSAYRMLLAEDIEVNREIVIALLEPTGIAIDCAENGVETLRMFSEDPSRYNFIFMDVQMPEMDGCEVTRRIRAMDEPHAKVVPIVAMTANVFREDVENCLSSGMDDHVGKPLDFDEVVSMLRKWLPSTARPSSPKVA